MSKAAVVIGVNETGHMAPLVGAARGANDFASWARDAGFDVTALTDDGKQQVRLQDIKDAITAIVDKKTYEQLVVFFAGHGLLKTPGVEIWLLSRAADDVDEAIDLFASSELARNAGIPHVIFVSDTCRSLGHRMRHFQVRGGSIFPNREPRPPRPPVDIFYATLPGSEAFEIEDATEAAKRYKGVFTECLLRALRGDVPEVVLEYEENGAKRFLIPSEKLEPYLETTVPEEASRVHIELQQYPEIRADSRPPLTFGELRKAPARVEVPPYLEDLRHGFVKHDAADIGRGGISPAPAAHAPPRRVRIESGTDFRNDVERIRRAPAREAFETGTGFTVHGTLTAAVVGGGGRADPFEEDGRWHVRVSPERETRSALLRLPSGHAAVLPVIPEFIGNVILDGDQVVDVGYTPSRSSPVYQDEFEHRAEKILERRAFAAVATKNGVFRMKDEDAPHAGDYLRMMKRLDPTLGIYAAYAYAQAGSLKEVRDVLDYMSRDDVVPYDLLVLAQDPTMWRDHRNRAAPFCPALTQGWSLLITDPESSAKLGDLVSKLAPSLWTLFRPEAADEVAAKLTRGELT